MTKPRKRLPRGVRRLKTGRYQAWAMVGGKRVYSRLVDDIETAQQIADAMRSQVARSLHTRPRTLRDACDLATDRAATDGTRTHLRGHFAIIFRHLPAESVLEAITRQHVTRMRDAMLRDVKPATVNRRLSALRLAFSHAIREGWCLENPASAANVPRPREHREKMDYFTGAELRAILERIAKIDDDTQRAQGGRVMVAIVSVMAMTGLRRSELARSLKTDWQIAGCSVHVRGKCGSRDVPFSPALVPEVEALIAAHAGPHLLGGVQADAISRRFHRWQRLLGEPRLHPHALRHTYATELVRAGHDLFTVMALLGHRTPAMTQVYYHVCGDAARSAAAGLRLLRPAPPPPEPDRP